MSRLIYRVELSRNLHGIQKARQSPSISNIPFVDGIMIFIRVRLNKAKVCGLTSRNIKHGLVKMLILRI